MARLTGKQREFINQYILNGRNATQAIIDAGYKIADPESMKGRQTAASMGYENLRKPHIREEINNRLREYAMPANEVLATLSDHARGTMADFVETDGNSLSFAFDKAKRRGSLHLIKSFEIRETKYGVHMKLELHDAQNALIQLGRYHKLFTDKVEITDWQTEAVQAIRAGEVDYPSLVEEFGEDLATQLFWEAGIPAELAP